MISLLSEFRAQSGHRLARLSHPDYQEVVSSSIAPWSPYEGRTSVVSHGRITLTSAFADLVQARQGFISYELPEIFAAPEDESENDAARDLVRLEAEHLTRMFAIGRLASFARPIGGGEIVSIEAWAWELDDPLPRFATGALNFKRWADSDAPPTHRIFVERAQFQEWLAELKPLGTLSNRQVEEIVDPQLRASRAVAIRKVSEQSRAAIDDNRPIPTSCDPPGVGPELLTLKQVSALIGRSSSTIYADEASGTFPERIKLGSSSRWKKSEVLAWVEEQAARRTRS